MQQLKHPSIPKRLIITLIALTTWILWLSLLGVNTAISNLINYWQITVTMFFGSMIAGGTSLGGGAVAFPVFTKLLHIPPHEAKIFSLAIQSVGMTAASLTIFLTKIPVEWRVIRWGSLGGILGIFLGLKVISPFFPADILKMSFTLMLTSFAITLFTLNQGKIPRKRSLKQWGKTEIIYCLIAGILGGMMSGLVGNGIDIVLFSVMVLAWHLSEKVATPTSVILMATNALFGLVCQVFLLKDFPINVQHYWWSAIPIVVIGAPLGAILCNGLHRKTIANCLIILILIELISSLLIIPLRPVIIISSIISLAVFSYLNYWLYRLPFKTLISVKQTLN